MRSRACIIAGVGVYSQPASRNSSVGGNWGSSHSGAETSGCNVGVQVCAGDLMELLRVPLRGEGSCGGGGAPRDSAGSGATEEGLTSLG